MNVTQQEFDLEQLKELKPVLNEKDEILEINEEILDDFQVVRREFFAHIKEPSITFNECKFSVNAACLSKFPSYNYAQVLINKEKRILALRPCGEDARDSYMWCKEKNGKKQSRAITCKLFFAKIVAMMGWNPQNRYKILGKIVHAKGEYLVIFDLTATEVYTKTLKEGEKSKSSRIPIYPEEWKNQFGIPYSEHKQSLQINIFDGYAIYSIKDTTELSGQTLIVEEQS